MSSLQGYEGDVDVHRTVANVQVRPLPPSLGRGTVADKQEKGFYSFASAMS